MSLQSRLKQQNDILKAQLKKAIEQILMLKQKLEARQKQIKLLQKRILNMPKNQDHQIFQSYNSENQSENYSSQEGNSSVKSEITQKKNFSHELISSSNFDSTIFDQPKLIVNLNFKLPEMNKLIRFPSERAIIINNQQIEEPQQKILINNKDSFKTFFVTGLSNNVPNILYSYPAKNDHFEAILYLLYSEQFLKQLQKTKSMTNLNKIMTTSIIKDKFVIPLRKLESLDFQYLIGCQTQQIVFKEGNYYVFSRFYCFLSEFKCIKIFMEMLGIIIKKIHTFKQIRFSKICDNQQELQNYLAESSANILFTTCLKYEVQSMLSRLLRNKFQYNQHMRIKLANQIVLSESLPSRDNESELVLLLPSVLSLQKLTINWHSENMQIVQQNLIIFMLVYFLCEKRILIYSSNKQKISLSLMILLELIKPLNYVNPIIEGTIKQYYSEYLEAPMSIVLGLWCQKKILAKKIQISMKKANINFKQMGLQELIERQKLIISDGIVINLDDSRTFGDMDNSLNLIANSINQQLNNTIVKPELRYKILNNMLRKVYDAEINSDWAKALKSKIKNTQLWSYHAGNK